MPPKKTSHYARDPDWHPIGQRDGILFVKTEDQLSLRSDQHALLGFFLRTLALPVSGKELETAWSTVSKADRETLDRWFSQLLTEKVILEGTSAQLEAKFSNYAPIAPGEKPIKHLVLGVCGSTLAAEIAHLVRALQLEVCEKLDVVITKAARKFVNLEILRRYGVRVWTNLSEIQGETTSPIHLARSAEAILVLPATAHTLSKVAHGECSDLLSYLITATRAPVVFFPGMNELMWNNPAIQRNVEQLKQDGYYVVQPDPSFAIADKGEKLTAMSPRVGPGNPDKVVEILFHVLNAHGSRKP